MGLDTPARLSGIYMAVVGSGMGSMMQTTNLIAQSSVHIKDIAAATGTSAFARNKSGSLGISVLGSIYASRLADTMGKPGTGGLHQSGQITPAALHSLPPAVPLRADMAPPRQRPPNRPPKNSPSNPRTFSACSSGTSGLR
ncbi:MAG: hypothetical protein ACXVYB_02020 [Arthrobacter sp.]